MRDDPRALARTLRAVEDGLLVVVTGAGVSLASGIPTFRGTDPDAVWHRDLTELGTWRFFQEDPVGSWRWYTDRFDHVMDKQPNAGHLALAAIERWHLARRGQFLLVTQNVDTLHEDAGSREVVKVHGSVDRVRCTRRGCKHGAPAGSLSRTSVPLADFLADPTPARLPRCPACGGLLRQHVLWFDEFYDEHLDYQWGRVLEAAATMDACLYVGTSFAVGVTALFLQEGARRGIPQVAVDPGAEGSPGPGVELVQAPSERLLPTVCELLGAAMNP